MSKNDASNFLGVIRDNVDDECYEEGCTFNEVINYYGHSETSVSLLFRVQGKLLCRGLELLTRSVIVTDSAVFPREVAMQPC